MELDPVLTRGPNVLIYRAPGLHTISLFDMPVLSDAQLLIATMHEFLGRGEQTSIVIDLRELRKLESGPFTHVSQPMLKHREALFPLCKAVAILHDGGMAAATVSGAVPMVFGNAFPAKTFTDDDIAFRWLQLSAQQHIEFVERQAQFRSAPSFTSNCRKYLAANLDSATLHGLAEFQNIDESELRRQLTAASTSFRAELRSARIDAAKEMLVETSMKMSEIAKAVGYKKQQNFTDAFRKSTGMTPSSWRSQ